MNSNYGFIITIDNFTSTEGRIMPIMGPNNITPKVMRELIYGHGIPFRMLDSDRNVMYEGRIIINRENCKDNPHMLFRPLDNFGYPVAGATIIQYHKYKSDVWEDYKV